MSSLRVSVASRPLWELFCETKIGANKSKLSSNRNVKSMSNHSHIMQGQPHHYKNQHVKKMSQQLVTKMTVTAVVYHRTEPCRQ